MFRIRQVHVLEYTLDMLLLPTIIDVHLIEFQLALYVYVVLIHLVLHHDLNNSAIRVVVRAQLSMETNVMKAIVHLK